ncbi:hypothetical protein K1X13_05200 [Nocardioides sp. WL0053]|uniref:Uncharacterized protein n=1 Tax=Nocardioides jiangsuensis TaxID=2866161 RepID=A0ABS7RK59_9ACTN|nr:hypothetical protein [Nocardioides jiangsuensis]MBY9074215.1 hypothetical protein [Nocardioides jiangsuensis]
MTHGLATKSRTDHVRRQVRGPHLAPESLGAAAPSTTPSQAAAPHSDNGVVRMRTRRPRRDGATRVGAVVPLDSDKRASLAKPLAALGWEKTTKLVAEVDGHRVVVRAGERTAERPWLVAVRVSAGRLGLPPTLTGALAVDGGDQVLAVALPASGELRLVAAADALQELTGELQPDEAAGGASSAAPSVPSTRVRPAFGM